MRPEGYYRAYAGIALGRENGCATSTVVSSVKNAASCKDGQESFFSKLTAKWMWQ
jgi:hypothetical protein